jgi:hypothetical protein
VPDRAHGHHGVHEPVFFMTDELTTESDTYVIDVVVL